MALDPAWRGRSSRRAGSGDALLSSARLWGTDLLVEALRVEDDDDPTPVPSVRDWFRALGRRRGPGREAEDDAAAGPDGCFVLFAAAAPA